MALKLLAISFRASLNSSQEPYFYIDVSVGEAVKKLFFEKHGFIIVVAPSPGETSSGDVTNGGYFTKSFLRVLKKDLQKSRPEWQEIFDRAKMKSSNENDQNAQYLVSLHKHRKSFQEDKKYFDEGSLYEK